MAGDVPTLTEREAARARLKASVDALAYQANLQVQMQKEPLKLLGGASAVGALLGLVVGRQFRRSKKIYVDAYSPDRQQKALIKAQQKQKGGGVGGALVATLSTLAFRALNDRVLTPKLEELAGNLMDKAGQAGDRTGGTPTRAVPARQGQSWSLGGHRDAPERGESPAAAFLKRDEGAPGRDAQRTGVPGAPGVSGVSSSVATPNSTVEAKAQGSPINAEEKANPNIR